jgi:hypothetical protein
MVGSELALEGKGLTIASSSTESLHTAEVAGSIPASPTQKTRRFAGKTFIKIEHVEGSSASCAATAQQRGVSCANLTFRSLSRSSAQLRYGTSLEGGIVIGITEGPPIRVA